MGFVDLLQKEGSAVYVIPSSAFRSRSRQLFLFVF